MQQSNQENLGSTAHLTHSFTKLQQHRWVLPYENRRIAVLNVCTCRKQTMEPCATKKPKQARQSSRKLHSSIKKTVRPSASTAASHRNNRNYFPSLRRPCQSLKSCTRLSDAERGDCYNSSNRHFCHKISTVPDSHMALVCVYVGDVLSGVLIPPIGWLPISTPLHSFFPHRTLQSNFPLPLQSCALPSCLCVCACLRERCMRLYKVQKGN